MTRKLWLILFAVATGCGKAGPPPSFTLTISRSGSAAGAGKVTSVPEGISCGTSCSLKVASGTSVTLTAAADPGATFAGWSGASCAGTSPCTIDVVGDVSVDAAFTRATSTLTVTPTGNGTGRVVSSPAGLDCGSTCTLSLEVGARVALTATADAGSTFVGWTGGGCSGNGVCVVEGAGDLGVQAAFAKNDSLVVTLAGNGTGLVFSDPAGISCGSSCSAQFGPSTTVTLSAVALADSVFAGWSGACTGTGACTVTLDAAKLVTATFALKEYALTVTRAGGGTGTVTSGPPGIDCGTSCTASFPSGTDVTLTATPSAGSTFAGWSGGGCSGTSPCVIAATKALAVTATFAIQTHALTVTLAGNGAGTVLSSPMGIDCGASCSAAFPQGTMVTLSAAPAAGSLFAGWSGACMGAGACVVLMSAATSVTATFSRDQSIVTVTRSGTGLGFVTSSPSGINCGTACSAPFDNGTTVTLTAIAALGTTFDGWSGGGCTGTGPCTVAVTAATAVTASFTTIRYRLSITRMGLPTPGHCTSSPAGISCPYDCQAMFDYGTVVTLTVTGYGTFYGGWTGDCNAFSGPTCTLTMTKDMFVNAYY